MELVIGLLVWTIGGGLAFHFGKARLGHRDRATSALRRLGFRAAEYGGTWNLHNQALSVRYHRDDQELHFHFMAPAGLSATRSAEFDRLMIALFEQPALEFTQYFAIDFRPADDHLALTLTINSELNSMVLRALQEALQQCFLPVAGLALAPMPDFQRMWKLTALEGFPATNEAALHHCWHALERSETTRPSGANQVEPDPSEPAYHYFRSVLDTIGQPAASAYAAQFRVTVAFQIVAARLATPMQYSLLKNVMLDMPDRFDSYRMRLWELNPDSGKNQSQIISLIDAAQATQAGMIKKVIQQSPRSMQKALWHKAFHRPFLKETALEALSRFHDEDLIPFLVENLRGGLMEDRLVAVLAQHPNPKAQDALVDCLDLPHLYPRLKNHLNRRRDDRFLTTLAEAVLNPETCNEALLHFSDIRDERMLEAMLTALTRPDLTERVLGHLIHRRERQVLPALAAAAKQENLPMSARCTIAGSLKMFTEPLAHETLHQLARRKAPDLVLTALDSLAFMQKAGDIEFLRNLHASVPNSECRAAVDRAIARIREAHRHAEVGMLTPVAPAEQGGLTIADPGGDLSIAKPK